VAQRVTSPGGWSDEFQDLVRGLAGGLMIGIPLTYTMEIWAIGAILSPLAVFPMLAVTYLINLGSVSWVGFRSGNGGLGQALSDALDATALALVSAGLVLALLDRIGPGDPLSSDIGRILQSAIPFSLGIAIANHLLPRGDTRVESEDDEAGQAEQSTSSSRATLLELGASAMGALLFCIAIAPTDEIRVLATELPPIFLPVMIGASLLISYGIVFVADFAGHEGRSTATGVLQHPITETVAAYLISLLVAGGALWIFGPITPETDPFLIYTMMIILGLPAAIGGAAGRLAV
jgi:putative integral membrane protein (TIGR02587 family)